MTLLSHLGPVCQTDRDVHTLHTHSKDEVKVLTLQPKLETPQKVD